jgi:hypothetical protein
MKRVVCERGRRGKGIEIDKRDGSRAWRDCYIMFLSSSELYLFTGFWTMDLRGCLGLINKPAQSRIRGFCFSAVIDYTQAGGVAALSRLRK